MNKSFFFDDMQNHSTETSNRIYGIESSAVPNTDNRHIKGCIKTSIDWHLIINIGQDNPLRVLVDNTAPPESLVPGSAMIAPHSSNAIPVGTDLTHFCNSIAAASRLQQEIFISATLTNIMADLTNRYFPPPPPLRPSEALRQRSMVLVHPQRILDLRIFLGDPNASFRHPEQAELVEKMQSRQNHLLAILPCGIGKTFMVLFQAKIYDYDKVTILLLPLSGLHADFRRRADQCSVSYSEWLPDGHFNPNVSVIYVSIEHASFDTFVT